MAPFDFSHASFLVQLLVFGAVGFAFGATLEMAGFGDTRKLAAQFYLREMTVLKVMFTAIVVAAILLAGASTLGLLDMNRVWVNPTFLYPEIVGGLIMGVGFVIGGFCPGTSLVAAATLKVDGMLFVVGGLVGVWIFGESVSSFDSFFLSSSMGRFTLQAWLHLPTGVVVFLITAMALAMFAGGELLERVFGGADVPRTHPWVKRGGAALVLLASGALVVRGEPTAAQRWRWAPAQAHLDLESRAVFASPAEVVALRKDTSIEVSIYDLRDEHDANLFHIGGAHRVSLGDLTQPERLKALLDQPRTSVTFLVSNGEAAAKAAWQVLRAQGVQNLYIVEGGVNRWLDLYPVPACVAERATAASDDTLAYHFAYATGSSLPSAWPELPRSKEFRSPCTIEEALTEAVREHGITWPDHPYTKRVKLQVRNVVKGGCG